MATIIRGSGIPALSGTAVASDVVSGKTFYNTDATTIMTGTRSSSMTFNTVFGSTRSTSSSDIPNAGMTGYASIPVRDFNRAVITMSYKYIPGEFATYYIRKYRNGSLIATLYSKSYSNTTQAASSNRTEFSNTSFNISDADTLVLGCSSGGYMSNGWFEFNTTITVS